MIAPDMAIRWAGRLDGTRRKVPVIRSIAVIDQPSWKESSVRRTLALAGAAVISVTGLAGPASADSGAGIAHHDAVYIKEVGAELDSGGGFIEIKNNALSAVDIGGWRVIGCTTVDEFDVEIPAGTVLDPGEKYLVGDGDFNGSGSSLPNASFGAGEVLLQADGGARLEDATGVVVDEIAWGDDPVSCASSPVGVSPTDTESINHPTAPGGAWFLADPTPGTCG